MKYQTLIEVRNAIGKINEDAGEILIDGFDLYREYYKRDTSLPCTITECFPQEARDHFINNYANKWGVEKEQVGLWDALLNRPIVTLEYVRDAISKINGDAGKILIDGVTSYLKYYKRDTFLLQGITEYFPQESRDHFISNYADQLGVEKEQVGLWDALLSRPIKPVLTLEYVRDAIAKINEDAGKILIDDVASYREYYKRDTLLFYGIAKNFPQESRAHFISNYADQLGVEKERVGLWDALLNRPIITLKYVRDTIAKVNEDAGEILIYGVASYRKHYKRDTSLPSDIIERFSHESRDQFISNYADQLGVEKELVGLWDALLNRPNVTLEYVRDAIVKINEGAGKILIDGVTSYQEYYKRDYFLPCNITESFPQDSRDHFISNYAIQLNVEKEQVGLWDALLNRPIITLEYMRDAIAKINEDAGEILIDGVVSYQEYYKRDTYLPYQIKACFPQESQDHFISNYANHLGVEKELVGLWDALLNRPITTLEYVRDAIAKINEDAGEILIDGVASYQEYYQRDSSLPYTITGYFPQDSQDHFISNYAIQLNVEKEQVDLWDALLYKNRKYTLARIKKSHPKWFNYFDSFMLDKSNIAQKERTFKNFIQYFIDEFGYSANPLIFLAQKDKKINLNEYENFFSCFGDTSKKQFHTVIVEFIDFIIADLSGFDNDTEEDEAPLLSNTFTYFESNILHIKAPKFSESNKPRLAFSYIVKAREWIFPESCNNFRDLKHLHNLVDQDWVEVDKLQINAADLNCVWRHRKKDNKTSRKQDKNSGRSVEFVYEVWMPTRWVMLYTLLQVPIRGVQVSKLDSGEADSYLPTINNGEIEWVDNSSKLNTGTTQSFIKRYPGEHAGMYVTTNKTSSSQGGYAVPYIPFDLCKWIIKFREFQSMYNPLDKPTPWTEIKLRRKTNAKKLKSMGSQCFLFREMGDVTPMNEAVFRNAFAFVLAQIETEDLKLTKKLNDKNTLNSYETVYTPHSLRVSLISAYITDGKIPIEVVSKIVGHHSLMMTIYYTKIGDGEFRYYLEQAEISMLRTSGDKLALELLEKQLERADENLICNTEGGVERFTMNWPTSSYFISDIGICPMAGTGCNEGGEAIESTKTRLLYAPVERGYLGERNCPRCRFFMTGVAFTPGLAAVMHRIQTECGGVNEKYKEHTINVKILEDEEYDCEQINTPFTKRLELAKAVQSKEDYATRLNAHKVDIVAIARLVEMSLSLVNQSNSKNKLALVTNNDLGEMGVEYNDSSEFKLFDTVCQDSEIYSIVDATNIAPRRTQLIDAMLQANNVSSTLFKMSVQEQLKIGNQITQLLLKRLGSWDKLNSVAEGSSRLNENSISAVNSSSMKSITKEVQQLIDNAKCSGPQLEASAATNDDNVIDVKDIK